MASKSPANEFYAPHRIVWGIRVLTDPCRTNIKLFERMLSKRSSPEDPSDNPDPEALERTPLPARISDPNAHKVQMASNGGSKPDILSVWNFSHFLSR